jgi:hypothetical protein
MATESYKASDRCSICGHSIYRHHRHAGHHSGYARCSSARCRCNVCVAVEVRKQERRLVALYAPDDWPGM